jgi:ATP-binding cassette subfamily B protein
MSQPSLPGLLGRERSNRELIRRLLALTWRYRAGCLRVMGLQLLLLGLGLSGLSLTGLGIDYIRSQVQPDAPPVRWLLGVRPPAQWTPMRVIAVIAGAVIGLAIVRAGLNYLYQISVVRLVQLQIVVQLRSQVYEKLQRLSFRFYDANASGSIINRVTSDVQQVRSFVDGVIIQSFIMLLSLAVYMTYMARIHPKLMFACLATTPLLWVMSAVFSKVVRPMYVRNRELVDTLVLNLSENIQGIAVTKGFAREHEAFERFRAANRAVRDQQRRIFWSVSIFSPTIGFFTQINLVVLLLYGGWLVSQDQLPLGTGMVVFAGLLQQFSGQVANIANVANSIQQSLTGARRMFEVLDAPVEIHSPPDAARLTRARGAVGFEHVWFEHRPGEPVLQDIEFETRPGQCVAILGATGAGKSTLLGLIPRFYDPTRGRVLVDGMDVRRIDLDDLRRNIGLVFQESFLFSTSVAANIAFGHPDAGRDAIERAARIAAAHEFIVQLPDGYDTVLREGGADLSGGQRQRLAIARALLLDPAILLLDDPTAAVDAQTEHEILEAIDNAMAGRSTFIVANRLSTLRRADLILVLEHGGIAQRGTHAELIGVKGPYRRAMLSQLSEEEHRRLREAST